MVYPNDHGHQQSPFAPRPSDQPSDERPFAGPGQAGTGGYGPESNEVPGHNPYAPQEHNPYAPQERDPSPYAPQEHSPYAPQQESPYAPQEPYAAREQGHGDSAYPPYDPGAGNDGPYGPYPPSEFSDLGGQPPGGKKNLMMWGGAAVAAVVVLGGGVGVAFAMTGDDKPAAKKPVSAPSSQKPATTPPPTTTQNADSRSSDPERLKLKEVFRNKKFKAKGSRYTMTVRRQDDKCRAGVLGGKLRKSLRKGDCTQILRASFATKDGKLIGTIGVANLKDASATEQANVAAKAKKSSLRALPGSGVTKKLGKGTAFGYRHARGHYLVLGWVQLPNGKETPKKKQAEAFVDHVVDGSNLGPALGYRATTGKPFGQ